MRQTLYLTKHWAIKKNILKQFIEEFVHRQLKTGALSKNIYDFSNATFLLNPWNLVTLFCTFSPYLSNKQHFYWHVYLTVIVFLFFVYLLLENASQRCAVGRVNELDDFIYAPLQRVSVQNQLTVLLLHLKLHIKGTLWTRG